jgi:predicted metal-dependent hydrolase
MFEIKIEKLIRSHRRTLSIEISPEAEIIVRAPMRMPSSIIEQFIRDKQYWIIQKLELVKKKHIHKQKEFLDGEKFLYLGKEIELRISDEKVSALRIEDGCFILNQKYQKRAKKVFTVWYRGEAFRVISERVKVYSHQYNIKHSEIKLSNASGRWGSCSPNGNLNFNWRLIMAPMEVIDYVIVHELAHIEIKNHSKRFWIKVESIIPSYKICRRWLKDHGSRMMKMV